MFIQGNDPRKNIDKPKATWQQYVPQTDTLTVHVSEDPKSAIYFNGVPSMYNNGAAYQSDKADDYVSE